MTWKGNTEGHKKAAVKGWGRKRKGYATSRDRREQAAYERSEDRRRAKIERMSERMTHRRFYGGGE